MPFVDSPPSPSSIALTTPRRDGFIDTNEAAARRLEASGAYRVLRRLPEHLVRADAADRGQPLALLFARSTPSGPRPGRRSHAALLVTYDHEGTRETVATFSDGYAKTEDVANDDRTERNVLPLSDVSLRPFHGRITVMIHHEPSASMARVASIAPALRSTPIIASRDSVPWGTFGVDGTGLDAILATHGAFAETDTAEGACHALAAILRADMWRRWPRSPLPYILQNLGERRMRVEISGSTYAARDALKARGYRWSDGGGSIPKGWFLDLPKAAADREIAWVATRSDLADATASISDVYGN